VLYSKPAEASRSHISSHSQPSEEHISSGDSLLSRSIVLMVLSRINGSSGSPVIVFFLIFLQKYLFSPFYVNVLSKKSSFAFFLPFFLPLLNYNDTTAILIDFLGL